MDYTTVERVKQEMHIVSGSSADDALLAALVTTASRAWDRLCTGVMDAENYFLREDVVDEVLEGQIDYLGQAILCYPHKPIIHSVSSFTFQARSIDAAYTVDPSRIDFAGTRVVAYPSSLSIGFPSKCRVVISYNGGLATSGSALPADMQELVSILAARFYREAETGLADSIGVAELAQLVYTRAYPVRVVDGAEFYKRRVGWRHPA